MKLYFTRFIDDEAPNGTMFQQKWYGTQADQKKDAKALKSAGMREIEPQQVEVPTGKDGLLAWLNERGVRP